MQLRNVLLAGLFLCGGISAAHAGWVIEQTNTTTNPRGEASPPEPATMRISQGRLRVTQPNTTTLQDCVKQRFTVFVPERNTYWSGTFDDYLTEIRAARAKVEEGPAQATDDEERRERKANEVGLPQIVVRKTDEQEKIGGYDTTKYVIESSGRTFQELWMTSAFNINDDLDPKKYLACQEKLTKAMRGASADEFKALYKSADYLALVTSGFPMKTVIHHIAGMHTREVRSVTRADVPDSDFAPPASAQNVSLADLFGPPQ